MHRTHSQLSTWFWAAYLVSTQTPGMSATQFQRQLGLTRYETAFQILLRAATGLCFEELELALLTLERLGVRLRRIDRHPYSKLDAQWEVVSDLELHRATTT